MPRTEHDPTWGTIPRAPLAHCTSRVPKEPLWAGTIRRSRGRSSSDASPAAAAPTARSSAATAATAPHGRTSVPPTSPATTSGHRCGVCPYAELHAHSHFSFLDGASRPEHLVEEAVRLGIDTLTLTDHDGLYGIVRMAEAAQGQGVRTAFGAELSLGLTAPQNGVADPEGSHLLVLARREAGYHRLARAITAAQLAGAERASRATI